MVVVLSSTASLNRKPILIDLSHIIVFVVVHICLSSRPVVGSSHKVISSVHLLVDPSSRCSVQFLVFLVVDVSFSQVVVVLRLVASVILLEVVQQVLAVILIGGIEIVDIVDDFFFLVSKWNSR